MRCDVRYAVRCAVRCDLRCDLRCDVRCAVRCEETTCSSSFFLSTQTSPAISIGSRAHLQDDAVANVSMSARLLLHFVSFDFEEWRVDERVHVSVLCLLVLACMCVCVCMCLCA